VLRRRPRSACHLNQWPAVSDATRTGLIELRREANQGRLVADAIRELRAYRQPVVRTVHGQRDGQVTGYARDQGAGALAASLIAPYLSSVTTGDVYLDAKTIAGLEAVAAEANLRPIIGGRLTLRPFPTATAQRLASETGGVRVVPRPCVYADLRTIGVRGEEAAEHLREVIRGR